MDDLAFFTDGNDFHTKHEVYHTTRCNNDLKKSVNTAYFLKLLLLSMVSIIREELKTTL